MKRGGFELQPVAPFRLDLTAWTLRRRPDNVVDRWDGATYRRVLALADGHVEVAVTQPQRHASAPLRVEVHGRAVSAAVRGEVTAGLEKLLGLRVDLTEFYRTARADPRLGPLADRFLGMKPPRYLTVFECAVNAIACQQVTLTAGIRLLNRLTAAYGAALGVGEDAVRAFPSPRDLADCDVGELRQLGFSQQKARALIELAQSVAANEINLETLSGVPDGDVVTRLCTLRGIGRWSAEYMLLRGLGRFHIFPGDDVGGRNNLRRWLGLEDPLDYAGVQRTHANWQNYAGLVYFHLLLDRLAEAGHLASSADDSAPPGFRAT